MKSIRENKMSEHKDNHKIEVVNMPKESLDELTNTLSLFGYDTRRISDDILGLKK